MDGYEDLEAICAEELKEEIWRAEADEGAAVLSAWSNCVPNTEAIVAVKERVLELVDRLIPMLPQVERSGWLEKRACLADELMKYRSRE